MYKNFYGLTKNPFEISPDPYFFHPTPRHLEALANLDFGVRRGKGFIVVTGEVGTGKTLLIRCLLRELVANQVNFAYVFNPLLSVEDFFRCILHELGVEGPFQSKGAMLIALNDFLIKSHGEGKCTALIIDEAQNLTPELLEEVRLLTNLETAEHKLLQVLLVGQPELDDKLDSPDLRQLKQRVALRCALRPFDEVESRAYILKRLERAGAGPKSSIFASQALHSVHAHARGIPRLINVICENALLNGYAQQSRQITPRMIDEVVKDLRLDVQSAALSKPDDESSMTEIGLLRALLRLLRSGGVDSTLALNLREVKK
ncbi:MAG TPA: AAA family ATPase [Clostridia bacterium]|nr:AAA family ATPase [Clostridia bacterium]